MTRAPVVLAMRPACASPSSVSASPRKRMTAALPEARASAARATASGRGGAGSAVAIGSAGPSASLQAVSAGRISVAIPPGGLRAAATARAASCATFPASVEACTQLENGAATAAMSEASGASCWAW